MKTSCLCKYIISDRKLEQCGIELSAHPVDNIISRVASHEIVRAAELCCYVLFYGNMISKDVDKR